MGTGGSSMLSSPEWLRLLDLKRLTEYQKRRFYPTFRAKTAVFSLKKVLCDSYATNQKINFTSENLPTNIHTFITYKGVALNEQHLLV